MTTQEPATTSNDAAIKNMVLLAHAETAMSVGIPAEEVTAIYKQEGISVSQLAEAMPIEVTVSLTLSNGESEFAALLDQVNRAVSAATGVPRTALFGSPDNSPLDHACPKCGAIVGQICDKATLIRKEFHMARVEAFGAKQWAKTLLWVARIKKFQPTRMVISKRCYYFLMRRRPELTHRMTRRTRIRSAK